MIIHFFLQNATNFDKKLRYIIIGDSMNIFEMLILNMILISYPLLIYIIYIVANKNINKSEKDIFFNFILITSIFLAMRYGSYFDSTLKSFFLGSVVFLSIVKKRYVMSIILEGIVLTSYYPDFYSLVFFLFVYAIINFLAYIYHHYDNLKLSLLSSYLLFYNSSFFIWFLIFDLKKVYYAIILIIVYVILIKVLMMIVTQGEHIMKTHVAFKELQKEQKIRLSLFKITHEIKNPVAVCKAYLDMFDVDNKEHAKKYIPIIQNEIERLLLLLQDFLLVNKSNMRYEIMDVNMLLEDVSKNIQPLMDENHITFCVDTIDDELFINGDYNRLSQVMVNILKNSVEAQAKKITLKTNLTSQALEVFVLDNGQGMDSEIASKIYEPFYTTKPRGSGLGVSLSSEIINAHHGSIEYNSKVGLGTSVKITLPLCIF